MPRVAQGYRLVWSPLSLQLIYGQHRETHVSIKENKADYTTTHKVGHLVNVTIYILLSV